VPDTVLLEFRENGFDFVIAQSFDASTAIAGYHFQRFSICGKEARHEIALAIFEMN
jgi:hypothetical protein